MTAGLVLSLFPGLDVLGMGFEAEGFSVVSGPDVVWGRDVRTFRVQAGRFDGVIGGDPCQSHSTLANLVRAKGLSPRFGDLSGEFVRVVEESRPAWFLRENVPNAPDISPSGYLVTDFLLENSWLDAGNGFGHEQMRKRRFWFGWPEEHGKPPDLSHRIRMACFRLPERAPTTVRTPVCADHGEGHGGKRRRQAVLHRADAVPVKIGGSGKLKRTAMSRGVVRTPAVSQNRVNNSAEAKGRTQAVRACQRGHVQRSPGVTGRHHSNGMGSAHPGNPPNYTLAEMLRLQGLPETVLDHAPFTMDGKRRLVGNAVPLGMARELARALREVIEHRAGAAVLDGSVQGGDAGHPSGAGA